MTVKFSNSGKALITSTVYTHSQTVDVDDASVFPSIVDYGNDYFYVTFQNPSTGNSEICKVTDVMGNKLFIERAQDGTTAGSFGAGDKCENRLNAGALIEAVNDFDITSQTDPKYLRSNTDDTTTHVLTSHSDAKWPLVIGKFVGGSHNQKIKLQGSASPNIDFCSEQHERMMFGYSSLGYGQWYVHDGDNNSARLKLDEDGTLKLTATVSADGVTSETYSDATVFHSGLFTNNSSNWNTAYGWGDHADAGYLTSESASLQDVAARGNTLTTNVKFTEDGGGIEWYRNTDAASIKFYNDSDGDTNSRLEFNIRDNKNEFFLFTSYDHETDSDAEQLKIHPTADMTFRGNKVYDAGDFTNNATNWDTAHGWGDHADAGYLTAETHASAGYLTAVPSKQSPATAQELGNVDLDDYAQPADAGFYHQTANVDADIEDNWPNGRAGSLLVQKSANSGNFGATQLFIDYTLSDVYVRSMYNDSGPDKAWKRLYTTSDFTNNSSNWNTAYSWGNHADAGYLTAETHASAGYLTSHQDISGKLDKSGGTLTGGLSGTTATFAQQISANEIVYPLTISATDVGNTINQNYGDGVGLQFKLANNESGGGSFLGGSIAAVRGNHVDANSTTTLEFYVSNNDETLDKALAINSDLSSAFEGTISATGGNSTDWNTAYGWGNHADAGYLTSETHADAGYLTSHQDISGKLDKSGGTLTGATTIEADSNALTLYSDTNGVGVGVNFSDQTDRQQKGYFRYYHSDTHSYGSGNAFVASGSEPTMTFLADGKLMYKDGIYSKPADGTGAGTRKDANWDTAYGWGNHASAGYLTAETHASAGYLTSHQDISGKLDKSGGTMTGPLTIEGTSPQIKFVDTGDHDDFWVHVNTNRFYVLNDRDENGSWETPYALELDAGINKSYTFGNEIWHAGNFTDNSSNWDTAHGWGNHASAGYLTSHQSISGKANLSGANFSGNVARVGTGSNAEYSADTAVMSGFGLIGNRANPFYITNSSASGSVQIGVGGAHNANSKLSITSALASFTVPISTTGSITASGNVTAYSDERLKEDVETLDGSKVYEMRGVSFTKDGEAGSGVIAQEMQKVAPELVHDDGEYLSVAYGNTIGYLIEAIKDLKEEVDDLKAKLEDKD